MGLGSRDKRDHSLLHDVALWKRKGLAGPGSPGSLGRLMNRRGAWLDPAEADETKVRNALNPEA